MNRKSQRGVSYIEFALSLLVLVPLLLGTIGIGLNLIRAFQTIQVARDAGHMYARGVDFSQTGNKTILANLAVNIGLNSTSGVLGTAGSGSAVAIFSTVTYIDATACQKCGSTYYSGGAPTASCRNLSKWVFGQRIIIGDSNMRTSGYGSPVVTGNSPVTIGADGTISPTDQCGNTGDQATFTSINPYQSVSGTVSGLPSGQLIYISEVADRGFILPPFMNNPIQYAFGMF